MHEVSIMQSALDSAMEELHKAGGDRITRMKLRVGVLSGVVPEALEFAFAALKASTPAAAAELKIEMAPAYFRCLDCKAMVERIEMTFVCPTCNGALIVDHGGRQLELTQLELN
ncbi:MAG: hydrogenase maturation nickel metallochaperone HypA [Haloferula sp.]